VVSAADPLRPQSRFSRPGPLIFLTNSSSIVLTRLRGSLPRVEAGYNTSTVIPVSHKRQQKGNPVPGGITRLPCSWSYKYGNLALQVGVVSDETVKYSREFCGTSTQE
jgi:hypothetical protein